MAETTPGHDLPYPEPTDDTNPPADIQALAERLEEVLDDHEAAFVPDAREIEAGVGLTGGGDLSANRSLAVDFAGSGVSSSTKAVRANDSRLSNARPPTAHAHGGRIVAVPNFGPLVDALVITEADTPTEIFSQEIWIPDEPNEYSIKVELDLELVAADSDNQPTAEVYLKLDGDPEGTHPQRFRVPVAGTVRLGTHREWALSNLDAGLDRVLTVEVVMTLPVGAVPDDQTLRIIKEGTQMILESPNGFEP